MIKRALFVSLITTSLAILLHFFILAPYANAVTSECIIVNVNIQGTPKELPPHCMNSFVGEKGITYPPGFSCLSQYCPMPESKDGSYRIYSTMSNRSGLKKLVGVIYTVTQRWKKLHPNGWVWVGDLNAPGHASHKTGVDVDIYASVDGKKCAANYDNNDSNGACDKDNYNANATIEFGKMFADTGAIKVIFYNDPNVNSQVLNYAKQNGSSPGMEMYPWPGHANHFHVRINP